MKKKMKKRMMMVMTKEGKKKMMMIMITEERMKMVMEKKIMKMIMNHYHN